MRPIFHLSFPVANLQEAIDFYTKELGAAIGRQRSAVADVLIFGAQVTLHNDPSIAGQPVVRSRHFGATLDWNEWEAIVARFSGAPHVVEPPTISYEGEPTEQGKMMISDPSGNLVELKAYRHPEMVLRSLAG